MKKKISAVVAVVLCFAMVTGVKSVVATSVVSSADEIEDVGITIYYLPDRSIPEDAVKISISREITEYLRTGDISFTLRTSNGNARDFTIEENEYDREERVISRRTVTFALLGSERRMDAYLGETLYLSENEFASLASLATDLLSGVDCTISNLSLPQGYELVNSEFRGTQSPGAEFSGGIVYGSSADITVWVYLKPLETPPDQPNDDPPDVPPGEDPPDDPIPPEQPAPWASERVNRAIEEDIVPEFFQEKYTQPATREEFCSLGVALYEKFNGEILGRKEFTDTDNVDVQKMAYIGVVGGTNAEGTLFNPSGQISRAGAATLLTNLANAIGKPLPVNAANFADAALIPPWALQAVGQVQGAGIMGSTGNDMFSPNELYSRQQSIITMLLLYDALL